MPSKGTIPGTPSDTSYYPSVYTESLPSPFPYSMPLEEPISFPPSEPSDSPSAGTLIFPTTFPSNNPMEDPNPVTPSESRDSPSYSPSSLSSSVTFQNQVVYPLQALHHQC